MAIFLRRTLQLVQVVPRTRATFQLRRGLASIKIPPITTPLSEQLSTTVKEPVARPDSLVIPMEEVAKHNTKNDCWLVIHGNVYNVTSWIENHPGGTVILEGAGKDATELFYAMPHGTTAISELKNYLIGRVSNYKPRYTCLDPFPRTITE